MILSSTHSHIPNMTSSSTFDHTFVVNQIFWRSAWSWGFIRISAFLNVSWCNLSPSLSPHLSSLWRPFSYMVALKLSSSSYTFHFMIHSTPYFWFITSWFFGVLHQSKVSLCFPWSESSLFHLSFWFPLCSLFSIISPSLWSYEILFVHFSIFKASPFQSSQLSHGDTFTVTFFDQWISSFHVYFLHILTFHGQCHSNFILSTSQTQ